MLDKVGIGGKMRKLQFRSSIKESFVEEGFGSLKIWSCCQFLVDRRFDRAISIDTNLLERLTLPGFIALLKKDYAGNNAGQQQYPCYCSPSLVVHVTFLA
jgi:hypothetical protein